MGSMNQDHRVLNEKQIYKVFQNIESIKNTAKLIWKKLEETCNEWPDASPRIGKVFLSLLSDIKVHYTPYIKGVPKALRSLSKLKKSNTQFADFLNRSSSYANPLDNALSTLLISPITRLSFYEHNLRELFLLTPQDHVDYIDLSKVYKEIGTLHNELSSLMDEGHKIEKVFSSMSLLKGSVPDILVSKTEGRAFIREGPVTILSERKNRRGHLSLYTDVLVISELNEQNEKVFDQMINLSNCEAKDIILPTESAPFSISRDNKRIALSAYTIAERDSWVKDIQILINILSNVKNNVPKPSLKRGLSTNQSNNFYPSRSLPHLNTPRRMDSVNPSLPSLKKMKSKSHLSEAFLRAISRQHNNMNLEAFLENIPYDIALSKLVPKECIIKFKGPSEDDGSEKYTSFASARSVSTFPHDRHTNKKMNSPLADQYGLSAWSNRIISVIADGGHGIRFRQASERAVESCLSYFEDIKTPAEELKHMGLELLKSISYAHETIIHDKKDIWEAGTTSILVSCVVEVEPTAETGQKRWCFVCATVGDCKAYHWSKQERTVTEITQGSNIIGDVADPGGRIGPYIYQGAPDLRNLGVYYHYCSEDDLIILCTDGIHDNFDPELCGKIPKELYSFLDEDESATIELMTQWDQLDPQIVDILKQRYSEGLLEKLLLDLEQPLNTRKVTKALINYCIKQTRNAREFFDHIQKQSSVDYRMYPGRLDHSTCLAFKVSAVQI